MTVKIPIGCFDMNFDIAAPHIITDAELGVEEVRPGVGVQQSGVDDLHMAAVDSRHIGRKPQTVLPDILHQFLHRCQK